MSGPPPGRPLGLDRRWAVAALALVAAGVWGAVAWRATSALSGPDAALAPIAVDGPVPDVAGGALRVPPPYAGSFPDPFAPDPSALRPAAPSAGGPPPRPADGGAGAMTFDEALDYGDYGDEYSDPYLEPEPEPPPVTVVGVVGGRVLLETADGGGAVLGPGGRVGEVEVVDVDGLTVVLRYRGYDFTVAGETGG